MQVIIQLVNTSCQFHDESACAFILVDVNGIKEPNRRGRDVFDFVLKETGLYPRLCDVANIERYCSGNNGLGCACKVLM